MWVVPPSSYNDVMTTITTQTIPTKPDSKSSGRIRHMVSAFVAGAVLAGAAATGITAAVTNDSSAPSAAPTTKVVYVSQSGPADPCLAHRLGPC